MIFSWFPVPNPLLLSVKRIPFDQIEERRKSEGKEEILERSEKGRNPIEIEEKAKKKIREKG